ncbi:hypothetical protein G7046_g5024 [Stylonectria norvegica]|nr:hypothetical protein G7046_g5024 [Stylonectria norvegica]
MSSDQIILLDLASKDPCSTWLRHSWKTRLLLNYKGVDYKTEWTEYPAIQGKVEPHLPPNKKGPAYTIPTVKLADGTWITDSSKIAQALNEIHPDPFLDLESPYQKQVDQIVINLGQSICPMLYSRIPVNLLNEASVEYWYTTRRQRLGMSVQEYEEKHGGEAAYVNAEPDLKQITALLKEKEGPFLMGSEPTYADFTWVAMLLFSKRVDEGIFNELLKRTGDEAVHKSLLEACGPWLKMI